MDTLFCVYNLKPGQTPEGYEEYLRKTKIPGVRSAPWCEEFNTWRIDRVLSPAVSEPEGELPKEPPYTFIAKIEVSDLNAMVQFLETTAGQDFVKSWSIFIEPTAIFTIGHEC